MNELNKTVNKLLKELGCTPALSGFKYLMYIIIHLIETNSNFVPSIKMYSTTAEHFNTTFDSVSGAVRKIITQSFDRANPKLYQKVFYRTLNKTPTCSEYIYTVVDYIQTHFI